MSIGIPPIPDFRYLILPDTRTTSAKSLIHSLMQRTGRITGKSNVWGRGLDRAGRAAQLPSCRQLGHNGSAAAKCPSSRQLANVAPRMPVWLDQGVNLTALLQKI